MNIETVKINAPEGCNFVLGMSHFIKTVEDIYELMVNSVPGVKFGVAFSEASGDRLVRVAGNDSELTKLAGETVLQLASGHCFLILMRNAYPVNILQGLKNVYEVVNIFCATANPVQALVVRSEQGGGIIGVIDGESPVGIEDDAAAKKRHQFLRTIGYKQ